MGSKKITTDIFIKRAKKIHGDTYGYDNVVYIKMDVKVIFNCKTHGDFLQTPFTHLQGHGCKNCGKERTLLSLTKSPEQFIEECKIIHNDKYSYKKTEYTTSRNSVIVSCSIHGDFVQKSGSHLAGKGCPKCKLDIQKQTHLKTTEEFIEDAVKAHGNKFMYDKTIYTKHSEKLLIKCKVHNEYFSQTASNHLQGCGCPRCAKESRQQTNSKTTEYFIEKARAIHNNKYSYEKTDYVKSSEKVKIECPLHGSFLQTPHSHLKGQGCSKCGNEAYWSRTSWVKKANKRVCTFYTIRCFNEDEEFYKIGRTMDAVEKRYSGNKAMPYEYEVISETKGSAGFIWDLERDEKRKLKSLHYLPELYFGGSKTECFTDYKL